MIPPIGRHGKPLGMVAHVAHSPERGWILRAVSEYFHRAKEEGLFVAIVLVPSRSSHEPNYSHEDPDQATGSGSRHAVAGWQDRAGQARSKKLRRRARNTMSRRRLSQTGLQFPTWPHISEPRAKKM